MGCLIFTSNRSCTETWNRRISLLEPKSNYKLSTLDLPTFSNRVSTTPLGFRLGCLNPQKYCWISLVTISKLICGVWEWFWGVWYLKDSSFLWGRPTISNYSIWSTFSEFKSFKKFYRILKTNLIKVNSNYWIVWVEINSPIGINLWIIRIFNLWVSNRWSWCPSC